VVEAAGVLVLRLALGRGAGHARDRDQVLQQRDETLGLHGVDRRRDGGRKRFGSALRRDDERVESGHA
jgi:hypothetical protein